MSLRNGRPSLISGTPIARDVSVQNTEVEQRTSSAESIASSDAVWDTSPIGLREPPSSPTTPPEDTEPERDEEIELSPLKPYPRPARATRPPLKPNLRAKNPQIKRKRARLPTNESPIGSGASLDGPQTVINPLDGGSKKRHSRKSCDPEDEFKEEHEVKEDDQLIPYFPGSADEQKSKSQNADTHQDNTGNGTQIVDASSSTHYHDASRSRENEYFFMPGGWHRDFDTSCSNMVPSKNDESVEKIKEDQDNVSLSRPETSKKVVKSPIYGLRRQRRRQQLEANDFSREESIQQVEKTVEERESITPDPNSFTPYHAESKPKKDLSLSNKKLHQLFGKMNVRQSSDGKTKSRSMSKKDLENDDSSLRNASLGEGLGYIYMFEYSDRPGFIKIGMTSQLAEDRIQQWHKKCGQPISIINDQHDKAFYNFDLVEKIIHIELWSKRRKLKCSKCSAAHRDFLLNTVSPPKNPTKICKKPVSHGEWFEIGHEEALAVIEKWRRWMSPEMPYSSEKTCTTWHNTLRIKAANHVQFVRNKTILAAPCDRDGRLRDCWVRRFHALPEVKDMNWEDWRKPRRWDDVYLELINFTAEKVRTNHRRASSFGFSARKAIESIEELFINGIAFVSSMTLIFIAVYLYQMLGAIGLIIECLLLFCYFTLRWFFEQN